MSRTITSHHVNGCNECIRITPTEQVTLGGAPSGYFVDVFSRPGDGTEAALRMLLPFQNGPIAEVGTNGLTHEALLAIVADRLECFQAGPYACAENAEALEHVRAAAAALARRTAGRLARGVEGTSTV